MDVFKSFNDDNEHYQIFKQKVLNEWSGLKEFCCKQASKLCEIESKYHGGQSTVIADLQLCLSQYNSSIGANFIPDQDYIKLKDLLKPVDSTFDKKFKHYLNVVSIIGVAGMGKSTLCKSILQEFKNSETSFEYMFYIKLSNVDCNKKCTLLSFLAKSFNGQCMYIKDLREAILDEISNSQKVCIILDGLDETNFFEDINHRNPNLYDEIEAGAFIKGLLLGNILLKAKKIVTSRPRKFYELTSHLQHYSIINVLGLNETSQAKLCQAIYQYRCTDILMIVQSDPDLLDFCRVPLHFVFVMHVINDFLMEENVDLYLSHFSVTNILAATLMLLLHHHKVKDKKNQVICLAGLAWSCISQKKFSFNDLKKLGLLEITIDSLLETLFEYDDLTFNFYIAFQNFFSALHMYLQKSTDFDESLSKISINKHCFSIIIFVAGFVNSYTRKYIQELIPKQKLQKKIGCEKIDSELLNFLNNIEHCKKHLEICRLFFERKDDQFIQNLSCLKEITISGEIFFLDLFRLFYLMWKTSSYTISVKATFCGESLKWLKNIGRFPPHCKWDWLVVKNECIDDDAVSAIATILEYIQALRFSYMFCSKTPFKGIIDLAEAIRKKTIKIGTLEIECNSEDITCGVRRLLHDCRFLIQSLKVDTGSKKRDNLEEIGEGKTILDDMLISHKRRIDLDEEVRNKKSTSSSAEWYVMECSSSDSQTSQQQTPK